MGFSANLDLGGLIPTTSVQSQSGTKVSKRNLSQESIDQLIYQALAADQGLAQLLSSENLAGGRGSSSATLQAQDFMTKIISELATVTSELTETTQSTAGAKKKMASVICTELARQGLLSKELYESGQAHFDQIPLETKLGYWSWATKVVPLMQKSPLLCKVLQPIVQSRYEMITGQGFRILGALTIYVGQPICWLIGAVISAGEKYGRVQSGT